MKKNRMLRLASVMLVLTMLSTCIISGTFAKYTTEGVTDESARVAKWGVTVEATEGTFDREYDAATPNVDNVSSQTITKSVSSTEKVVAPGTEGVLPEIKISGTPEVAVSVNFEAVLTLSGWEYQDGRINTIYCPIIITVGNTDYKMGDNDPSNHTYNSLDALTDAVQNAIKDYSANYKAGQNLTQTGTVKVPVVSWKWEYEPSGTYQTNAKDTALGDAIANATSTPTIGLKITTTVTQID